jgi:hypothetical protein
MKIQAISSWQNGQEKLGTEFNLYVINDNLSTSATFYYSISSEEVSHLETKTVIDPITGEEVTTDILVIDAYAEKLVDGNLTMDGADYQTWDADPSANEAAYVWSMAKLNLVAVV